MVLHKLVQKWFSPDTCTEILAQSTKAVVVRKKTTKLRYHSGTTMVVI